MLLFYRYIDFGTKYARGGENGEVKIWQFTGSRTGSVVRLFVHFLAFLDDISYPIAALGRCFDCSSTICLPYAILDNFETCP